MRIQTSVKLKRARQTAAAPASACVAMVVMAIACAAAGCSTIKSITSKKPAAASIPAASASSPQSSSAASHSSSAAPAPGPAVASPVVVPEASSPPIGAVGGANVDQVVASVDGEPITQREAIEFAAATGNPIPSDEFSTNPIAKKAVKALIGQKLLESEVKNYQDKVDDAQVDKYIVQVRADKHMSDAELRAQLQAQGMSYEELRKHARADLQKAMMVQQQVREKIQVSNADIQVYYDAHKADFTVKKERLKLAQILIEVPANATPEQVAAAQKKADQVYARAAKGQDFNDLARTYSDDDSKANGGELGWFEPTDVMDEILAAVKGLKPGQISVVIRTKHGFHIVKLEEHEVPGLKPLPEVKDQIRNALMNEQTNTRIQSWIETDLVKKHYVETMY
ncbi:MAG: peptidylprolyl isomerase [Candidatus Binatus sp.]|uniref:peptidylprolyl isomerase n=1 Tax=Candidatus Binatus sp. TaxID=2811406 RepID=UPI0027237665|nr:peptidylprolyl isomerase [Candidatus Binatus sp.]MDO8433526.1 peptidylprolyl isomerase [Candidatus Binatus sp.]